MKKSVKWILGIALSPFVLFLLITILLYIPPVQQWAVNIASGYASRETGMDISVGEVRLSFPLDLRLGDVKALKQNDSLSHLTDTILDAKDIICDIQLMPLFSSNVEIDAINLRNVKINTTDFIAAARVKGSLEQLDLESHGIDLKAETLMLNTAYIKNANLDISLADSVPEDTSTTENKWKINVQDLLVEQSAVKLHMPGDTLTFGASMMQLHGKGGYFDLQKPIYKLDQLDIKGATATMDNRFTKPVKEGLDPNHLSFSNINVYMEKFVYDQPQISLFLKNATLKEKSGIEVRQLTTHLNMDTLSVHMPDLQFETPNSKLGAKIDLDFNVMDETKPGQLYANVDGYFGKQDLMMFMGSMPQGFRRGWPNQPLTIKGAVRGNMKRLMLTGLNIQLPSAFRLNLNGQMTSLDKPDLLSANLDINAATYNLNFAKSLADPSLFKTINIPNGITAKGKIILANADKVDANMTVTEGGGIVNANAHMTLSTMTYDANIKASRLKLNHFVKGMGLGTFSGHIIAKGHGFDVMSPKTSLRANATISQMSYGKYDLSGTRANITLSGGNCDLTLDANNPLINGSINVSGLLSKKNVDITLSSDITDIDLYRLGLVDHPLNVGVRGDVVLSTDMDEYYKVQGRISNLSVADSANVYHPDDMVIDILTTHDQTHAVVDCGDFHLDSDLTGGYKSLMKISDKLMAELQRQMENHTINEKALRQLLPEGHFYLTSGGDNPIARSIAYFGVGFAQVTSDFTISHIDGLNGDMRIDTLRLNNDMQLDLVKMNFKSDEETLHYNALIENGPDNPQVCFKATADGYLTDNGTRLKLDLLDNKGKEIIFLGLNGEAQSDGIRINIDDQHNPILGYKQFSVNPDNYIFLSKDMRASANVKLKSTDGTSVYVYSDDENTEALQDLTLSLGNFNLAEIVAAVPYMPNVSGIMNGDFHVIMTPDNTSISSDVNFKNLIYEHCPMGNISSEFVYIPKEDGSHYIDGVLYEDGHEVGTLKGSYNPNNGGNLDAVLSMANLPLDIANGFIPNQIIGLKGKGNGDLSIKGPLNRLQVNGELNTEDAYLISVPYGVNLRFANTPVRIVGSHLLFENFKMYANNDQPLVCNGFFDFSDFDHMNLDMRMSANDFLVIDAKENRRSEAYGKCYINFLGNMKGELSRLKVRGKLDILAKSDIYYILRDSPITTDNRLKELVTFTDFAEESEPETAKPSIDGLDADININVNDGTHIKAWLNTDHSNYVDLIGGGALRMLLKGDDMSLTGRYTINDGEMKYSLPVIPLKTFQITQGSYVEFTGDMMNPTLHITAKEENKAGVTVDGTNRMVLFRCGVVLSKTLQNMGLEFVIEAPEDQNVQDQLNVMSKEEQGKLAVTMLTTGMYLADGNTNNFAMNSALSSFLQQEINNIAGSALKTLDFSVGLENSTDEYGSMHTDYSFKFAKRFWNNRLSISVGGKISTGPDVNGQNRQFFDNVDVQYRLADDSNQYLQLFYKRAVYDYLEGYLGEYGAGYMWKRRLRHFKDILRFTEGREDVPTDTIQIEK